MTISEIFAISGDRIHSTPIESLHISRATREAVLTLPSGSYNGALLDLERQICIKYNLSRCTIKVSGEENGGTAAVVGAASVASTSNGRPAKTRPTNASILHGKPIKAQPTHIIDVTSESGKVAIKGDCFAATSRETRGGYIFRFDMTDYTSSITCKLTGLDKNTCAKLEEAVKAGGCYTVNGMAGEDKFSGDVTLTVYDISVAEREERTDTAEEKRVELHLHTQMSSMDGLTPVKAAVKRAAAWGHDAIAITDHGVVQSFPDAMDAIPKDSDFKVIYGMEGYLVNKPMPPVVNPTDGAINDNIVIFDIETTGLKYDADSIIEFGAVRIVNGEIADTFQQLINPGFSLPANIVELTHIRDMDLQGMPDIATVLPQFLEFVGDSAVVAHNAPFDTGFVAAWANKLGIDGLRGPIIDTVRLSRSLLPNLQRHSLAAVTSHLKIKNSQHHRALADAEATARVYLHCVGLLRDKGARTLEDVNKLCDNGDSNREMLYHIILLAKNQTGLRNLYELVSESHIHHYYRKPRIPKELLERKREGLIIGSACESGELYTAILRGEPAEKVEKIAKFYDYLEIQPLGNNRFLLANGTLPNEDALIKINRDIYEWGKKLGKPVVATCDVHFLDERDGIYRKALMKGQGFADADNQPGLFLRTTDEMLAEFAHMGEDVAREVVITNTRLVADMIEKLRPIPKGTYPPVIDNAVDEVKRLTYEKAAELYGDPLPDIVSARIEKELLPIVKYGFCTMYYLGHKLVTRSNADGYVVGSRGSVGSSLVAHLCGITEVNALEPHYQCPSCKYSEFPYVDGVPEGVEPAGCGIDLPDKACPNCATQLKKDGHNIPFETFLGFDGDKEPDIDLNFGGEYQARAHKYAESLLGEKNVYRSGTISTLASKTAYGFVKKYADETKANWTNTELNRIVQGCIGVKRTTGQHPGGLVIVPKGRDIHEFCPIQHPADDSGKGVTTTHFDFNAMHGTLLKLDILGHDDPSMIRMLQDLTEPLGAPLPTQIPLDDQKVMSLFTSTEALGVTPADIGSNVGTYGVPEFGTKFVRGMVEDAQPMTFAELVYISGLSHGTDVWLGNAQDLITQGTATLKNVISSRDDIMTYLVRKGVPNFEAFTIMESVRKGKGLKPEWEDLMKQYKVPSWYISSCKSIKYLFPKAHAVAYVTMAYRIAYYKVYYPKQFYMAYYSIRADEFDAEVMCRGFEVAKRKHEEIEALGNDANPKDKNQLPILEIVCEMYKRGINFAPIDVYQSDATRFLDAEEGIRPPLSSLAGCGASAAQSIVNARADGTFGSIDELQSRAKVSKTVIEALEKHGCLRGMPRSNQLSLFDMGL